MNKKHQQDIARKLKILNHAESIANIAKTCRYFGICRETFYTWTRIFDKEGALGLINNKPCPGNQKLRIAKPIDEKIIYLRKQ